MIIKPTRPTRSLLLWTNSTLEECVCVLERVAVVGGHLQAAACPEVQRKPQLLTRPLASYSSALAPFEARLVIPIHQQ